MGAHVRSPHAVLYGDGARHTPRAASATGATGPFES
jgi:hypothetical protein